jgi:regulatory protein
MSGNASSHDTAPGHAEDPPGDPEAVARLLCLRQLEARPRTRAELARYLARKGVDEEPARRVLDRFTEVGLIDDQAFAQSFAAARQSDQGLARRAIAMKLRQRGVDEEVVRSALGGIDSDTEYERAVALVRAKQRALSGLDPAVQARRLVGLLGRKGYPAGVAYRVVRQQLPALVGGLDSDPDGPLG